MRRVVGLTLILAAGCAASLASAEGGAAPPQVSFTQLPSGWRALGAAQGGYALSWRYRENPYGWAGSMPKNAIAVSVFFPRRKTARYPALKLVLPTMPATTLEGAPDTPEYRIHGRVLGRDVEVWVDIRRPKPTEAQLKAAQRVVSGIRFARPS